MCHTRCQSPALTPSVIPALSAPFDPVVTTQVRLRVKSSMASDKASPGDATPTDPPALPQAQEELIGNDVLGFMRCKMDIMPKDQLVDVLQGYFKLDAITEARDLLYRNPPPDLPGRLKRRTSKRDILED